MQPQEEKVSLSKSSKQLLAKEIICSDIHTNSISAMFQNSATGVDYKGLVEAFTDTVYNILLFKFSFRSQE